MGSGAQSHRLDAVGSEQLFELPAAGLGAFPPANPSVLTSSRVDQAWGDGRNRRDPSFE